MAQAPVRVVVADDETHIRTLVSTIVHSLGYQIVGEASNGVEAVTLTKAGNPDLVLMDINIPRKNGVEGF